MSADVLSPLPGLVATVHVNTGDVIASGDPVVTLQSMKMEIPVTAESDGVRGDAGDAGVAPTTHRWLRMSFRRSAEAGSMTRTTGR